MANNYTETEIKLYVPDLGAVENKLKEAGATLKAERVLETNNRYDDANGHLSATGQVLRLRQDTRARLTFKEEAEGENVSARARFEAETQVEDFEAMHTILERLGYHVSFVYEKYRTTYTLGDAEIVLDETPIGTFVEIEADDADIEQIIQQLGLNEAQEMPGSYGVLFQNVKQALGLNVRDMTFENFKGVYVPESALHGSDE